MNLETIFKGPVTPQKWKMLGDYLRSTQLHPGDGVRINRSHSTGSVISAVREIPPERSQSPPFSVLTFRKEQGTDPAEYVVTLQEGIVLERHTRSGVDGVQEHEVKIGADYMSSRPYPELTIESGDTIWCNYSTDSDGLLDDIPVVVASSDTNETQHHIPVSGATTGSGTEGDYWIKLFEFEVIDGKPTFTYFQQSDIEHSRLWKGKNIGGARYIHKEFDETNGEYDFRTLEQFEPVGRTYGKVIVPFVNGDEQDDANDSIKFSAIAERASNPQVNVKDDGAGIITVEGNGNSGVLEWSNCEDPAVTVTLLQWEDGLIVTNEDTKITAGCSGSGSGG
jgi:hypothetical protein